MKELLKTTSLLLLLLVSGFTLSSCSDDDNEAGALPELVGTWVCTDSYEASYEDGQKIDEYTDEDQGRSFTLNANGTLSMGNYTVGSWSSDGGTMWITVTDEDGTWTTTYSMRKHSADSYTLSYDISYNEDGSSYREVYSMTLQRQGTGSDTDDDDDVSIPVDSTIGPDLGQVPTRDPGYATGVSITTDEVVGSWTLVSGYSAAYQHGALLDSEVYTRDEGVGDIMTLNADGTCTVSNGLNGTWRLVGSHLYLTVSEDGYAETVDYIVAARSADKVELRIDYTVDHPTSSIHGVESITFQRI